MLRIHKYTKMKYCFCSCLFLFIKCILNGNNQRYKTEKSTINKNNIKHDEKIRKKNNMEEKQKQNNIKIK